MRMFWAAVQIACAELLSVRGRTLLDALGIAFVLASLLVLLGLKHGVVSGFATEVLNTPESLRVYVRNSRPFTPADLERMRSLPGVAFVAPNVTAISQHLSMRAKDGAGDEVDAYLLPSGHGDPHLPAGVADLSEQEVIAGKDLAEALKLTGGDTVLVRGERANGREEVLVPLKVAGTADLSQWYANAVLVHPSLSTGLDAWTMGTAGISFDGSQPDFGSSAVKSFPAVRLYVSSLRDVESVVHTLNVSGFQASPRALIVRERFALERAMNIALWVIVAVSAGAFAVAVLSSLLARTFRLAPAMATAHLYGMQRWSVSLVPIIQCLIVSVVGWCIAVPTTLGAAEVLNGLLPVILQDLRVTGPACRVPPGAFLVAGAATVLLSIPPAIWGAMALARRSTVEVLHED